MIEVKNKTFILHTDHTTYAFAVTETGQLEHLYYGKRIKIGDAKPFQQKRVCPQGNMISYDQDHFCMSLEDMSLEASFHGKGDIREPFAEIIHADGNSTCDFIYDSYEVISGKRELEGLPSSYGASDELQSLIIYLKELNYDLTIELSYAVFETVDVITRSARLLNHSDNTVTVERMLSLQLDLPAEDMKMTSFHGTWAREMERCDWPLKPGKLVCESTAGCSSSRANPFVMISEQNTTEDYGRCYGFNLIYSGNHYEAVETNAFGKARFVTGINPSGFQFQVGPGEQFQAPEAVMTFSTDGYGGMSRQMHAFVRNHIVRGEWKEKQRPILLNSWEAAYFDINESKLVKLAQAAKDVGIELLVMDDGWFGQRDNDTSSLGDWYPNKKKLPGGLKGLADKINHVGLQFGIWVEPEMVNVESELYKAHPDWAMAVPGMPHSEGRSQRILDLANPEVCEYLIDSLTKVFECANIAYVKWDMNRIFSDVYSPFLQADRQMETAHRYMLGLYHVMNTLTERFPKILFEGCAAGGNRFDLGILCYFPQIWASDDTDACERMRIQTGYSYGYPLSTVSAHVSGCPNHQTLRITPMETRYHVASLGVMGYELNLCDMSKSELEEVRQQVALYKENRQLLQYGTLYRGRTQGMYVSTVVAPDKAKAVTVLMQEMTRPNPQDVRLQVKGLDPDKLYHFTNLFRKHDLMAFGDLVNTAAPIHIKQDSLLHKAVAKFVGMDGEVEDNAVYADALAEAGVILKQPFSGTGYNDQVRFFPDYASRMYFTEQIVDEEALETQAAIVTRDEIAMQV